MIYKQTMHNPRQPSTQQNRRLILLEDLCEGLASRTLWLSGLERLGADLVLGVAGSVWVQAEEDLLVAERVLLLDGGALGAGITLGGADNGLDFGGVDETANVSLGDDGGWEEEVLLERRGGGGGAVDSVEGLEGGGGPDDETSEVATRCELEEVQGVDGRGLDTGDVAESERKLWSVGGRVVDDEGSTALAVTAATELTLTGAELLGSLNLGDICASSDRVEESHGSGGACDRGVGEDLGVDHERNLWDGGDLVTASEEEGWDGGSSQGGSSCETLLSQVDLLVPLAPDLGRGEHATGSAHVTEGSLTSTVSSASRDTRNTGNSATCEVFQSAFPFFASKQNSTPSYDFCSVFHIEHDHPSYSPLDFPSFPAPECITSMYKIVY